MILSNEGLKSDKKLTICCVILGLEEELKYKKKKGWMFSLSLWLYMAYSNTVAREVLLNVSDYDTVNDFPFNSE